ncbi:MAG: hypothetical protein J0L93_09310 [Deltaproteobacteria bacterium]|nr:hypothetical protein [Deltaproteobacteria bacterium]
MKKYLFILGLASLTGCGEQPQQTYRTVDYKSNSEEALMIIGEEGSAKDAACTSDFTNNLVNFGTVDCAIDIVNLKACPVSSLRDWIGYSANQGNPGFTRAQTFTFTNLVPDQVYSLKVYTLYSYFGGTGKASITNGEITAGGTYDFTPLNTPDITNIKCSPFQNDPWKISFKSSSSTATVRIGNDAMTGTTFFYPDYYVITKN